MITDIQNNEQNNDNRSINNNTNDSININHPLRGITREEINNSIREVDERNMRLMRRGFNIFLLHGFSQEELRNFRLLFHLSRLQTSLLRGENLDWNSEAMYQREERWLMAQLIDNNRPGRRLSRRENERNNLVGLNSNIGVYVGIRRERRESNIYFLEGLVIGFALNIFTIIPLFVNRTRPKLSLGLFSGMFISIFITILPFLFKK